MSNGIDRQFGKLIALSEEHGKQLDNLFIKVDDLTGVIGKQNALVEKNGIGINEHERRIGGLERLRWWILAGSIVILCAIFGVDKVVAFFGR